MRGDKTKDNFRFEIGTIIKDDKRDLLVLQHFYKPKTRWKSKEHIDKRTFQEKWYKVKCNVCQYDNIQITKNNLERGDGCPCCSGKIIVPGINDIPTTAPWMVDYFQGGYEEAKLYTSGSGKKIFPVCPFCGKIKNTPMQINAIHRLHSIGCVCSDGISYPEKFFMSILNQLNISYVYQLSKSTFEWCDKYRYDFYLPAYNCIIETHGIQHYKECTLTERTLIEEQRNDKIKKDIALKNGIDNYIVLDCRESSSKYIINSIKQNSTLCFLLKNIDNIDIRQCEIDSTKNKVYEVCQIKNKNPTYSTSDISKIVNLERSTVKKYLKIGNNIGLCNYDIKKELKLRSIKGGKHSAYEINVIDANTHNIIKTYESAKYLSQNSINDFGVYFGEEMARHAAKYNELYKGYIIKYSKDIDKVAI